MKSNPFTDNNSNRYINSSIHACYEFNLIFKIIKDIIRNKKIRKNILGTKRFNFQCHNAYPDISIAEIEDFEYLAYYFILITKKY